MALYLENFGLGFFEEDDNTLMGLIAHTVKDGKGITGYYGLPYLNLHLGAVQMIARTGHREEGDGLEVQGLDTHAKGQAVWECRLSDADIEIKDKDKLQKRVMVNRLDGGGMAVVTLVNADVLPCFLAGDIIKMQMIGFPELIQYFPDETAYAEEQPSFGNGKKFLLSEGCVFPSGLMKNRNPEDQYFETSDHLDDITNIRGTVKALHYGTVTINDSSNDSFIFCDIDTEFGPLQIVHTIGQVDEKMRKNIKKGAIVSFYGLLSGDVAILDYEKGIVRDEEHNLCALRYMFSGDDPERIRNILSDDCIYVAEYNGTVFSGPDAVIERMKYVQKKHSEQYFAHLATIASVDGGDAKLDYSAGKRCLVLASGAEEKYESIAFIDVNEEGNITRIVTSVEPRYHFAIDKKPQKKSFFEDVKLPESVVEPIILRAKFHGIIDESITEDVVIGETDKDKSYEDNIRLMLSEMPQADADIEKKLANLFGYLFAKAAEMEYAEHHPTGLRGLFHSRLTAIYTPADAWKGEIHSALDKNRHEKLESAMVLGRQFYKDLKFYQDRVGNSSLEENMLRALMTVQKLGRLYSKECLG